MSAKAPGAGEGGERMDDGPPGRGRVGKEWREGNPGIQSVAVERAIGSDVMKIVDHSPLGQPFNSQTGVGLGPNNK
jgi:hypothetical protein